MTTETDAASDARYERDRGCAVSAEEARQRAATRRERGLDTDAGVYWDAYAAEVESWDQS